MIVYTIGLDEFGLHVMELLISLFKILLFFFIFFITKISENYEFIYNIFPDIKKGGDESYKTVLLIIMNTLLITSYTIAFSFMMSSESYGKFYYVFLILITTITKWQYEKLYHKIFIYQERKNFVDFKSNDFIQEIMSEEKITEKNSKMVDDLIGSLNEIY